MSRMEKHRAIVLGVSAGGMKLVKELVTSLPVGFRLPVILVQHISGHTENVWPEMLNKQCLVRVKEAEEKELIKQGTVYMAPPDYHLLIEADYTFTLTSDEKVNYARPSIDVLFETAADAYGQSLIGIVGTGGNADGARGLKRIQQAGGMTIVQHPETAEVPAMPRAALREITPDHVLNITEIIQLLLDIDHLQSYKPDEVAF